MGSVLTFATGPVQLDDDGDCTRRELGRALGEAMGFEVDVVACPSYAALAAAVETGQAAIAWLPPATFVRVHRSGVVTRIFSAERTNGARYQAALFVSSATSIETLGALAGKRVAWVDRDSCAGYLFPKLELLERGIVPSSFFSEEQFVESHLRVVRAVRDGQADAGATYVQLRSLDASAATRDASPHELAKSLALVGWAPFVPPAAMRPLLVSRPIPADALCATRAMPSKAIRAFDKTLASIADKPKLARLFRALMNADRFAPSDASAYAEVERAMTSSESEVAGAPTTTTETA